MKITFKDFKGTAPKYDEEELADGYANKSLNTRSGRQMLEPWRASVILDTVATPSVQSIFKYRTKWFSWGVETYATRVPLTNDPYEYVIITQEGQPPRLTHNQIAESGAGPYPAATQLLNVPVPSAPSVFSVEAADDWFEGEGGNIPEEPPTEDEYDKSVTAYALVYYDAWGRLSALGDPSDTTDLVEYDFFATQKITLTLPTPPTDLLLTDATRGTTAKVRVYRTNFAGGGTGVFQYVGETDATASQFVDQKFSGDLLDSPINETWTGAPDTNTALFPNGSMQKIIVMGSDILVGHNKRLVCFAEPGAFYAYPVEYFKAFTETIVTISPAGSNAVVLTDSYPYVLQGSHPASMEAVRLAEPIPCSNSRGVTEVAGSVFYVSSTGLFRVTEFKIENVSRAYMTEREWRALGTSTIELANYDGMVFIRCPAISKTYVFSPFDPKDGLREVDLDATCFFQMDETNDLAFVRVGESSIRQFDADGALHMLMDWESKTYDLNSPACFSFLKVKAKQYPVTVEIESGDSAGATTSATRTVNDSNFVYLPFENMTRHYRAKVTSTVPSSVVEIRSIQIGDSPTEFD